MLNVPYASVDHARLRDDLLLQVTKMKSGKNSAVLPKKTRLDFRLNAQLRRSSLERDSSVTCSFRFVQRTCGERNADEEACAELEDILEVLEGKKKHETRKGS